MQVVLRWVKDRWVIGNYDLKRALSPIVSTAQKSGCVEKHFLHDLYPSKLIIYAFLVFISESMQTLFLFNMRRKGKWKNAQGRFKMDFIIFVTSVQLGLP